MPTLRLNPAQQRRLMKLARDAGRTPEQALRIVLRDGFDYCEWEVRESLAAESDAARHATISDDDAQRAARTMIESTHARRGKQAT